MRSTKPVASAKMIKRWVSFTHADNTSLATRGAWPRVEEIVKPTRAFLLLPVNRVKLSSPEFLQILELAAARPDACCILRRGKVRGLTSRA